MLFLDHIQQRSRAPYNGSQTSFVDGTVTEPVTKDEVKAYCKLNTGTSEDTLLDIFITAARQQCEAYTNIGFIPRVVTAVITNLCGGIFLPYGPTQDITSVTDKDGNVLVADEGYTIQGTKWKQLLTPLEDGLIVVYDAGYGDEYDLPGELKLAVLQQVFYLYQNRGEISDVTRIGIPTETTLSQQAKATLNRLKRV